MPLIVSAGITKKAGLPDYGSVGASCSVQFELDAGFLQNDPDGFQKHVHDAYAACCQAVNDELTRHVSDSHGQRQAGQGAGKSTAGQTNGASHNGKDRGASAKQLSYARQLAGKIQGLTPRSLDPIAQRMFEKPLAGLTSLEASWLIDTLKEIKAGRLRVEDALNGVLS